MADNGIVDEFPATSAVLLAAAFVIEDACRPVNDQFMICKDKTEDPADCVPVGESVQHCVNSVFERIKKSPCQPSFEKFWKCLDMNNQNFIYCREEEQAFHQCVKVNLVYTTNGDCDFTGALGAEKEALEGGEARGGIQGRRGSARVE